MMIIGYVAKNGNMLNVVEELALYQNSRIETEFSEDNSLIYFVENLET